MVDALMELFKPIQNNSSFKDKKAAIDEALELSVEMENCVMAQLRHIKKKIDANEVLAKDVRAFAIEEAEEEKNRLELHKRYPSHLESLDKIIGEPSQRSIENNMPEFEGDKSRIWYHHERTKLSEGVHLEVKRLLSQQHVRNGEDWRVFEVERMNKDEIEWHSVELIDWSRISKVVHSKSPIECLIQWTNQEHPIIHKTPWTKEEDLLLETLVQSHGSDGKWELISKGMDNHRTPSQCFSRYQMNQYKGVRESWTAEDDESLRAAVAVVGDGNWQQVAATMGKKSGQQCLQRWRKSIDPAIRRTRWTRDEDVALKSAVVLYGEGHWAKICLHIPGRTDMQCRERWVNILNPSIKRDPLNDEEKNILSKLVAEHGQKWSLIARLMPGRTDNHLLREYKALVKSQKDGKEQGQEQEQEQQEQELKEKEQEQEQEKEQEKEKKKGNGRGRPKGKAKGKAKRKGKEQE
ncbi:Homeodomain-like protein [Phycomyces blakesleeanus]